MARFLALCNQLAYSGKGVSIDFSNNGSLKHYLNRAGFFDHLDEKVKVLPDRPKQSTAKSHKDNSKNLVEIGEVTPHEDEDAKDQLVTRLTNKFVNLTSNEYKAAVSTIFAELTGNIQEHSSTELKGFAGLQKYLGSRPHIQTVISDSGLGIASTLRPSLQSHHKELYKLYRDENIDNDIALVTRVMSDGLISRYGAGRGLGFKSSREHALKFKAKYSVRQERFSLEFLFENGDLKQVISKTNLVKICGTHICFDFNID
ncbi:MAG: ATP-binding protein [Halobacteriovoraceae bacterium]|nr:ATP-binding protein [Halobacteriovoraceae bacterium]